jgi:hypothetical protein
MSADRIAIAQLVGFYVAAGLTWAWIEVSCAISIVMGLVKWFGRNASSLAHSMGLEQQQKSTDTLPRFVYSPVEEGLFSTVFFAGLVWASYFIPDRAIEFAIAAYHAAEDHAQLVYEPNVMNISRSTTVAAMFWFFGSGWVGKVMPLDVPWSVVTIVWLLLTAAAGYGAAVLNLAAS